MSKLSRSLFRADPRTRDVEAIASSDPVKVARRIRNKIIGRSLGRLLTRLWRA